MKEKKGKLERMADKLPGEELLKKPVTRRGFVAGAGATSFGLLLAACGGDDDEEAAPAPPPAETGAAPPPPPADTGAAPPPPSGEDAPLKDGLGEGKYGGPVGFAGAERYQYPFDSEEGRAIAALRKMRQDGTAPDTLVVQVLNFARPQFENAFPEGAPTLRGPVRGGDRDQARVHRDRPRVRVRRTTCGTPRRRTAASTSSRRRSRRSATSPRPACCARSASTSRSTSRAGTTRSTASPAASRRSTCSRSTRTTTTWSPSTTTRSRTSTAATCSTAREEQAAFEDKYGRPLRVPADVGRPGRGRRVLHAARPAALRRRLDGRPFWGVVNWNERFVCSANPNMLYFNEDMSANVNNEAGIRAFAELLKALEWHGPGALEKDWLAQYQLMGAGNGWGGRVVPEPDQARPREPGPRHGERRPVHPLRRRCRAEWSTAC